VAVGHRCWWLVTVGIVLMVTWCVGVIVTIRGGSRSVVVRGKGRHRHDGASGCLVFSLPDVLDNQ
jgi:hypothetical protein